MGAPPGVSPIFGQKVLETFLLDFSTFPLAVNRIAGLGKARVLGAFTPSGVPSFGSPPP